VGFHDCIDVVLVVGLCVLGHRSRVSLEVVEGDSLEFLSREALAYSKAISRYVVVTYT
jgi:hypothetical protein